MDIAGDFSAYRASERLVDGRELLIRAVTPADREALRSGFARLSPDSVYFRFLGARRVLTEHELDFLTSPDFRSHVAIGAELREDGRLLPVGVARYIGGEPAQGDSPEFAVAVDETHHGLGIGTLLLKHLALIARAQGHRSLQGTVLAGNHEMLDVIAHLAERAGIAHREHGGDGVVAVQLDLAGPAAGTPGGQ